MYQNFGLSAIELKALHAKLIILVIILHNFDIKQKPNNSVR